MGNRMDSAPTESNGKLGTFAGVFTPSVLTILGIILFLRLGYVTGSAGLSRALVIILLANTVSVLTSFSLAAVATNLKVKGGGDYYLISRTLGIEFGGALGLVLFLAQSVSITFYCIGFGEALTVLLPASYGLSAQIIAAAAVALLFIFAWLGADWASRFQFGVMTLLVLALVSFFWGGLARWDSALLVGNWTAPAGGEAFWVLFAIFFPAVTGFTQGVSMSGDLKDPGKSLPLGTFLAVGISIVVYFGVALVFAAAAPNSVLMNDYGVMKKVARFSSLIDAGVVAATLSSAMASFLGAPRILQSLANDRIFPFLEFFAAGSGPANNPRRGVVLSAAIAFAGIALGNLNLMASVVSMFFLISYGLLNYATYYEATAASPSFRPRFRWYSPRISLLGWLACLGIILAIDFKTGIIAVSILLAIYQYLKRTASSPRWADSRRSHRLQQIREHLMAVSTEPDHPRDWRPYLVALTDDSENRGPLLQFAQWIEGGSGLTTAVWCLESEGADARKKRKEADAKLRSDLQNHGFATFPLVLSIPDLETGLSTLLQSYGLGPIKANTLLLNWFKHAPTELNRWKEHRFGRILRTAFRLGCNSIVFAGRHMQALSEHDKADRPRRIDVWWWGDATGRLTLLLAYLMTRHPDWEDAEIRLLAANYSENTPANREELAQILSEARIPARSDIIVDDDIDTLSVRSADTDMVFAPFSLKLNRIVDPYGGEIKDLIIRLPNVALVKAAEDIDLDAEPEEGKAADMAAAQDALHMAREKARLAEKEAAKADEAAQRFQQRLDIFKAQVESPEDKEALGKIEKSAQEARILAERTARKAAKAAVKSEQAQKEAMEKGIRIDSSAQEDEDE